MGGDSKRFPKENEIKEKERETDKGRERGEESRKKGRETKITRNQKTDFI